MFSTSNILTSGIKYYEQKQEQMYFIQHEYNTLYRYITDIQFNLNCIIIHILDINEIHKIYPNDVIYGEDCKMLFENYKARHDLYESYLSVNSLPENIKNLINCTF